MLLKLNFKQTFLLDAAGALVTALLLSLVLAKNEILFGMPQKSLFILVGAAASFCLYSFFCAILLRENWTPYLRGIAIANSLYCLFTLTLVLYHYQSLTPLGLAYFIGEVMLILGLVWLELRLVKNSK